jgi:hypothetical protein
MKKFCIAAIITTSLMLISACGVKQPQPVDNASQQLGAVAVTTDFPGARILLDGNITGRTTPDTLINIPAGDHVVRVVKDGYRVAPDSITVLVQKDSIAIAGFFLSEILNTGQVFVESTPPGAEILINGSSAGLLTPDTLVLEAGDYNLALNKNGYVDTDLGTVTVAAEQLTEHHAQLPVQRRVLVESFANTSCLPCTTTTRYLLELEESVPHDDIAVIEYFSNWPNIQDPFYQANPAGNRARFFTFYKISTVPSMFVMGTATDALSQTAIENGFSSALSAMTDDIGISVNSSFLDSVYVDVEITLFGTEPAGDVRLMVAVIEDDIQFDQPPGSNGLQYFTHVFRKFLTSDSGNPVMLSPGTQTFRFSSEYGSGWETANLKIVAFIQEWTSKQVIQSAFE